MPTTPGGLPYPASTAPNDVPADLQALAEAIEAGLGGWRIAETVLAAPAASIDFQNIPQTYRHLRLVMQARSDRASNEDSVAVRFNNDSAANYVWQELMALDATVSALSQTAQSQAVLGVIPAASSSAAMVAGLTVEIPNYRGTTFDKTAHGTGTLRTAAAGGRRMQSHGGHWVSTAAITRVTLLPTVGPNFVVGTVATLYGLV